MSPSPTQPVLASTSSSSRSKGEELMKDLVDHLLHSTTVQADKTITTLLPGAIAKEVAGQLGTALSKAVQAEVHKQVADAIAPERLQTSLRAMIQEELKRHTEAQLASVEATTRQAVTDIAPALVEQAADIRLGELTDSGIQKHLPHALQAHLDMITQLVKKKSSTWPRTVRDRRPRRLCGKWRKTRSCRQCNGSFQTWRKLRSGRKSRLSSPD